MPKEVFGRYQQSDNEYPKFRAILKWGHEGSAQLGVETDQYFSFHGSPDHNFDSLWFEFETRDDYNRMIKTLRKMRDQQFGRDE